MKLPHILSAKDFTRAQLDALFIRAAEIKKILVKNYHWLNADGLIVEDQTLLRLKDKTMALLFDQPSLRTSSSFEAAMYALSGNCVTYRNASQESSIAKDESLEDTIEMLSGNPNISVLVLRHPEVDAARRAANVSSVPIINAGDGTEHPTQALVDLFTIQEVLGTVDKKQICFVGDMHARTARSLLYALSLFDDIKTSYINPPDLELEPDVKRFLVDDRGWKFEDFGIFGGTVLSHCNVVYVLRAQTENWHKNEKNTKLRQRSIGESLKEYYRLCTVNNDTLSDMPKNSVVLHPRPRGPELSSEIDSDPRVLHAQQGRNGGPVRMALLEMMHSGEWLELASK